jgi:hypothetical protein
MKKIAITMSDDDFSKLEEIRNDYCRRSKGKKIAWLIREEWERLQEEKREKTPAELVEGIKAYVSQLEKKAADYGTPYNDTRIIQFPVRQFSGSV